MPTRIFQKFLLLEFGCSRSYRVYVIKNPTISNVANTVRGTSYFTDVLDITDCVSPSHSLISWIHWRVTCFMNLEYTSVVSTSKHCLKYLANIYLCKFHIHLCKLLQNNIKYQAHDKLLLSLLLLLLSLFFKCLHVHLMKNYVYNAFIIFAYYLIQNKI